MKKTFSVNQIKGGVVYIQYGKKGKGKVTDLNFYSIVGGDWGLGPISNLHLKIYFLKFKI